MIFTNIKYLQKMNELLQWQIDYQRNAYAHRGRIIDCFTRLELNIDEYLVRYFDVQNITDFKCVILDRLTFEAKRTSLKAILDKKALEGGFIKTKNNSYPHSKMIEQLRRLIDERNHFAHYLLSIPQEINDLYPVVLIEFRDSKSLIGYSQADINALISQNC